MVLSNLSVTNQLSGNFFYFAADTIYFNLYGQALALSLLKHAPWANVHVHLYNPTEPQKSWCREKNVSFTEETIDTDHPEFNTLCACIRFIRIPEIFSPTARILSFDCDVIANNNIPIEKFMASTNTSQVTIRKGNKSLASAISFGNDQFRDEYREQLLFHFNKDQIYWFLDQDILDRMMQEGKIQQLSSEWTSTKMTPDRMIWTAKGARKTENIQYVNLLDYYNSIK